VNLGATGCVGPQYPFEWVDGAIPFEVNAPLWTDGAIKDRALLLAETATVSVGDDGALVFPEGAVIGKRFSVDTGAETRLAEVRLLRRTAEGWDAISYQVDGVGVGTLVPEGGFEIELDFVDPPLTWLYPSQVDCLACHRVNPVLGPTVEQLNRDRDYDEWRANQLVALDAIGLFEPPLDGSVDDLPRAADPHDENVSAEQRARAVLHGNCAHCHQPGGWAPDDLPLDLRWSTPLADTHACDVEVMYTTMGTAGTKVFAPGDPADSNGLERMKTRGLGQMPMFGTYKLDVVGTNLVERWILGLAECP